MQTMSLSIIKNKDDIKVVSQFPCLLGHRLYIFCHSLMQSYFINNLVIQQQKIPWFKIFFVSHKVRVFNASEFYLRPLLRNCAQKTQQNCAL